MSAIAGIYNVSKEPVAIEQHLQMMACLRKYPADDIQVWHKDNLFLGCHAQWITPESVGEQLPFYDQEKKMVITADAIIDNREELFESLQIEQRKRVGYPDSQLILDAYYKWGEDVPKYLVGDFAFMIWDEREQKLFGARDFSGGRTLYYLKNIHTFAFCTAIEPLFSLSQISRLLNEEWLAQYLAISASIDTVDAGITPYLHVQQLPPSHSISIKNGNLTLKRYSKITTPRKLKLKSDQEYVEAFKDVFDKAITSRLRTHRQVGAHLSGGLDSGSVVSFANYHLIKENKQLHTYSYVPVNDFKDYTAKRLLPNETPYINSTVSFLGSNVCQNYLSFDNKDPYTEIDSFLDVLEMPYKYFENSYWIKGIFEHAYEDGVGVLLNGARGNFTISWGHADVYYALLLKRMKWIKLINELHFYSRNVGGPRLRKIPYLAGVAYPKLFDLFSNYQPYTFPTLINDQFAQRTNVYEKLAAVGLKKTGWFSDTDNFFDLRRRHFEDLFHWNSTNTMATKLSLPYSLWKRDTTNDIRVIEFCLSLPEDQYVQNGEDRSLIRRATKGYLPDKVRLNQRVRGVQGADWLHRMLPKWDAFTNECSSLIKDDLINEYFNMNVLKEALKKANDGVKPDSARDPYLKVLMRALIFYRFTQKLT